MFNRKFTPNLAYGSRQSRNTFNQHLQSQCHEIFDPCVFRQSITTRPQINTLTYRIFEFCFKFADILLLLSLVKCYAA
jgi:hypothetical protein